jgi:hypothetical protein
MLAMRALAALALAYLAVLGGLFVAQAGLIYPAPQHLSTHRRRVLLRSSSRRKTIWR